MAGYCCRDNERLVTAVTLVCDQRHEIGISGPETELESVRTADGLQVKDHSYAFRNRNELSPNASQDHFPRSSATPLSTTSNRCAHTPFTQLPLKNHGQYGESE